MAARAWIVGALGEGSLPPITRADGYDQCIGMDAFGIAPVAPVTMWDGGRSGTRSGPPSAWWAEQPYGSGKFQEF